ncbi:MAG TPA: CofH family radical SAM protein [Candidatus Acidoferrales bacterium]|nr:CofH family radical SAM protein [Candidatus Acidoferrales bacterium]
MRFADQTLIPIWERVHAGERLSFADGLALMRSPDLLGVGRMADWVKSRRHGERVFFVMNRYINPTNVCVLTCGFCDFAKRKGASDAYELTNEQILELINEEIREVHIVGGHHPDWRFERFEEMIRMIRRRWPHVQIKAFTAAEIDYFWRRWKIPPEEALSRLKQAGLDSMPGGGAEVFSDRVWKLLFPGKAGPERYLEIHRIAHRMGIPTNATILYGHIETDEERVRHLVRLREVQDEDPGFFTFIPLAYQISSHRLRERQASAIEDLKMIATSRLMLDNFEHIEAFWIDLGVECASMALHFGASDINGTLVEEKIAHAARAQSPAGVTRQRLLHMIRDAGKIPVERDALYNVIRVYERKADEDATDSLASANPDREK